jgi:hypothetical protein
MGCGLDWTGLGHGTVADFWENGNEVHKGRESLQKLSEYRLLKNDYIPWC